MAAPMSKQRPGRPRSQLPPCYYEGYLEKRSHKEKISRRLWTCLCGNTLFFFSNAKDNDYEEKLELSGFISLTDDCNRDRNLEAARLVLRMRNGETKLTAPSLEARELWKGYIYSVVELSVPSSLNLLPGQVHMLREVVERERERCKPPPIPSAPTSSLYLPLLGDMPACFQSVSRTEAELLLERRPDCGNMLLRPGRHGTSLAVTTRQDLNGSVFRHYRVTRKEDGGFAIDVENPIPCATLHDVVNCLVEKTSGTLKPFILEEPYDENITFVQSNDENGEKSLQCASTSPVPSVPVPPPKPGFVERVPSPEQESNPEENFYLNDPQDAEEENFTEHLPMPPPKTVKKALLPHQISLPSTTLSKEQHCNPSEDAEEENSMECLSRLLPKTVKKALLPHQISLPITPASKDQHSNPPDDRRAPKLPPVPAPRTSKSAEALDRIKRLSLASGDPLAQSISEELKQKLEKRRVNQE
ncbi:hypothetical protein MATL_G00030190 [Megalops atlanticus]|uniref:SH2 domain-containing protein n=1 Tax=Megalops atlanticus TaxID=7932 RepID=A0A9D3QH94_MEGAT|nr:hypothetical protein MATL_G00030190 [Megalops atlanticus]